MNKIGVIFINPQAAVLVNVNPFWTRTLASVSSALSKHLRVQDGDVDAVSTQQSSSTCAWSFPLRLLCCSASNTHVKEQVWIWTSCCSICASLIRVKWPKIIRPLLNELSPPPSANSQLQPQQAFIVGSDYSQNSCRVFSERLSHLIAATLNSS